MKRIRSISSESSAPTAWLTFATLPLIAACLLTACLLTACTSPNDQPAPSVEAEPAATSPSPNAGDSDTTNPAASPTAAPIAIATSAAIEPVDPPTAAPAPAPEVPAAKEPDVIFVPTPQQAVNRMLELAEIKPGDVVYDLGCGDGRIVVTAARKYGVRAVGVDIDPKRVAESRENVRTNEVEHLVTIRQADIFELDLSPANVVTLYLLPDLNVKLMPQLRKLKPGSRIVSYEFDMRGAKPHETVQQELDEGGYEYTIYKWIVPWEDEEEQP